MGYDKAALLPNLSSIQNVAVIKSWNLQSSFPTSSSSSVTCGRRNADSLME